MHVRLPLLLLTLICTRFAFASAEPGYAGAQACSRCHREIAGTQAKTAMANTWRGAVDPSIPRNLDAKKSEGPDPALLYDVRRHAGGFTFSVSMPDGVKSALPVEAIVGGARHGVSFLERIKQIDGIPLERPALIEGRYAYSPHGALVLSPGFTVEKPSTYEDALGRVLSPSFERECLLCHGQPGTLGADKLGGVRCESCHGPAADHVNSFTSGVHHPAIAPKPLKGADGMKVCAQCHTGLSNPSDPVPDDLLVSNQVPALSNSECFIQSGEGLTCTDCHNPHQDSSRVAEASVWTCLRCHSLSRPGHATICPINATGDCIRCHMPSVDRNSFRLADHWIRVHPEQGIKAAKRDPRLASQVPPKREFLRIIVAGDGDKAEAARQALAKGGSFADVAHRMSIDSTAAGGGFIGNMDLSQMDAKLAAAASKLSYGETSGVVDLDDGRHIILHRLHRDFRYDADQLFQKATTLKAHGDLKAAAETDEQALAVYPYFLRALVLMGTTLGEAGDARRASGILRFAVSFYPNDATAQFNLGLTLGKQPTGQIEAFRHAIDLDPDMVAAYESLGAAMYSAGQQQAAIDVFHKGLQIDPLSAILYYDLGSALRQQGDEPGAKQALALAAKLDPQIAARIKR